MKSQAFFLINIHPDSKSHPDEELRQISGINRVEEVSGLYDFLVEVEITARLTQISDILMAKPWVKRVHVLKMVSPDNPFREDSLSARLKPESGDITGNYRLLPSHSWLIPAL